MIVIGLTQQVSTDAEIKALTGMNDNHIVYHTGESCVYIYEEKQKTGDLIPDNGIGVWKKDRIDALNLAEYKNLRNKEIDDRTGELILNGFVYQSKTFSLSQNAQINISALHQSRDDLAMTYPINYNTIDDLDNYSVVDSNDLHNMYLTALGTKKAILDSGTALKDLIKNAVDEIAVELIIDNR